MRIGIDLGGTKIEAIALDDRGAVMRRHRVATPAGNYRGIIDAIAELVFSIERELGQKGTVGVGSPGALSLRTGLLKNSNSTALNGKPLDVDLSRALGRRIRLENDANCFALSEAIGGAAREVDTVFGVILGTGVGGGLVVNQRLVSGRNAIAGEWGHNPMPWPRADEWPGPPCYCGKTGCIETLISGPALTRELDARTARTMTAQEIAAAAKGGDAACQAVVTILEDRLARGLALVVNIFDPDRIVLGGGLSNINRLYAKVPPLISRYAFSDGVDTVVMRAAFGDSSGVRGAAWLWPPGEKAG
ncbi:MAG TPA: ROK family protein [Candidatus Binataceae bacterium]|nr:ROK family protein [Candidatus Binataceae bacterium]